MEMVTVQTSETAAWKGPDRRREPRRVLLSPADFRHFVRSVPKVAAGITRMGVRQAKQSDVSELLRVEEASWPEGARATKEMLASRIEVFPEGVLCATENGAIVGFSCWEIVAEQPKEIHGSWAKLTDGGTIRRTHRRDGSTLFGVSLSILPRAPKDTVWAIGEAARKLTIRRGLPWAALGSRIPRFHRFSNRMNVKEYLFRRNGSKHVDPELDLYIRIGLTPVRALPNFFPDPPSCNYGVLVEWRNPFTEISDQLDVWEAYRWFHLWEHKTRRRRSDGGHKA